MIQPDQMAFSADRRRMAARVAVYYFLRTATLITRAVDEDLVTALVFLGVQRANVRGLVRNPDIDATYASVSEIPPDDLREPVSVYAVAKALAMPYETVRRHTTKLREAGLAEVVDGGLLIPNQVHRSASMLAGMAENLEVSRRFLRDAILVGAAPAAPFSVAAEDVSRRTVRLSVEYFLDCLGLVARTVRLDPLSILIGLAVGRGNMEHLAQDRVTAETYAGVDAIPPDELRRPVSVYALSKSLGLPYETTRRYARRLTKDGWLDRKDDGGLILPSAVLGKPGVLQAGVEFAAKTQAYLTHLIEIGVTPSEDGVVAAAPPR